MAAAIPDEMPQQEYAASSTYSEEDDYSDEEEPWDQRRSDSASVGSSTLFAAQVHEKLQQEQQQGLEEGELPALTPTAPVPSSTTAAVQEEQQPNKMPKTARAPAPRAGWLLRSGQTTRRPLQPPSLAGLTGDGEPTPSNKLISPTESEMRRQERFWSQLDTDPTDDDDGPDDEVAARRSEDEDSGRGGDASDMLEQDDKIPRNKSNSGQDNASTAEETIDYSQEGATGNRDTDNGAGFCGDTLNALNEMCGGGLEQTDSGEATDNPPDIKPQRRLPFKSDEQEEYTAIEVEFVESNKPSGSSKQPRSPDASPGRKKGFSPALSGSSDRKMVSSPVASREAPQLSASKSSETSQPEGDSIAEPESKDEEEGGKVNDVMEDEADEDRIMPDVTAKRSAFLSALARKAKADFDKSKGSNQKMEHQSIDSKSSGESLDDDVYSTFTAPEKRKFLKLINTGHLPVDASRKILETRAAKEKEKKQKQEQAANRKNKRNKRLAFWKKNRPSSTNMPAPSSSRSTDEADDPAYDDEEELVGESESEEGEETPNSPKLLSPVIPNAAMTAMIALEKKAPRPESPPPPPPALEETEDVLSPKTKESEKERFARSGINYYDAVRRDLSDTDDEVAQSESARQSAEKKKTQRRIRPRGFSALREGIRSQSVPRSSRFPEAVSEDEPVHFSTRSRTLDGSKTMESGDLEAAPTNHTSDKKAQSRGWVDDGEDVFEGTGDDEGAASLKMRALISPPRKRQEDGSPRSLPRAHVTEQSTGVEFQTKKETDSEMRDGSAAATPVSARRTVADVAQTKKIGRDDEAMLARIEQEILRTAAPHDKTAPPPTTKPMPMMPATKKSPARGRSVSTPKMRPRRKNEMPLNQDEEKEFRLELDVDMETYMHSADVYSAAAQGRDTPHSDGRSVFTAATGASAYTQSSRKRRPGAARTRLAKAKEAFEKQAARKKGLGWHDSIQAAAASTNRVWKPGTGWVDYTDNSGEAAPPKSDEKLQVNLKKALTKNHRQKRDPSQRSVVPVPFPEDWEKERQQMIDSGLSSPDDVMDEVIRNTTESPPPHATRSVSPPVGRNVAPTDVLGQDMPTGPSPNEPLPVRPEESTPSSYVRRSEKVKRIKKHYSPARQRMVQSEEKQIGRPTGWLASMQAATAALNQEGKTWDAEHGWSMPDEEERRISDVVDFSSPRSTGSPGENSDMVDFSVPPPPPPTTPPHPSPYAENQKSDEDQIATHEKTQIDSPPSSRGPDGKLTQWVEKSGKEAKAGSLSADMDMSERAVASGASTEPEADSSSRLVAGVSAEPGTESSSRFVAGVSTEPEAPGSDRDVASRAFTEPEADSSSRLVAGVSTEPEADSSSRFVAGVSTEPEAPGSDRVVAGVSTEPEAPSAGTVGASTESYRGSARSVTSSGTNNTERYVQISDNGSVRAMRRNPKSGQRPVAAQEPRSLPTQVESDDEAHVTNDSIGAFPSTDDRPASAVVNIEKINDDDLNLFPNETREKRADRGLIPGQPSPARTPPRKSPTGQAVSPSTPPPSVPPSLSMASSAESSRRGGGPVDTDEVDETWDSDDEQRYSTGWETRSGGSTYSSSILTPSKPVPRLKESKRDTSPIRSRRLLARPGPESDAISDVSASKPVTPNSPGSSGVTSPQQERRAPPTNGATDWPNENASHPEMSKPTAEWRSFMDKKVSAETAAASQQRAQRRVIGGVRSEDDDSLFQFEEKKQQPYTSRELGRTNLSPINTRERPREDSSDGEHETSSGRQSDDRRGSRGQYADEDNRADSDVYGSEGYGPTPEDGRTFLQRLTECAAPVVQNARNQVGPMIVSARNHVNDLPSSHLAFMKNGNFSPSKNPLSCGKADVIDEEETVTESETGTQERSEKPRAKSNPRSRRSGGSSVASDDFGAKTAYLEAIAMKAAVSKPRRASSRGRGGSSVASSSTSQHSEKWKSFVERKKASGVSPGKGRSSNASDVSKAAERYAASKVEEMMAEMNADSVSSPGARKDVTMGKEYPEDTDDYGALRSYRNREGARDNAAQELSAARVQAMMTQLSGDQSQLEEGEI